MEKGDGRRPERLGPRGAEFRVGVEFFCACIGGSGDEKTRQINQMKVGDEKNRGGYPTK